MCGIAGIVAMRGPASPEEIDRMTRTVIHRGPDDHGYLGYNSDTRKARFTKEPADLQRENGCNLLLGHRRLSIIDLSESGRCPMPYDNGQLWIIHNGEVYNYIELREELKGLGYRFTTASDTEVILAAYKAWGTECLHRFNGMWAFALLDTEKSLLFCARDRLGVKPFYYHWDGATFSFGSEIKQLLTLRRVSKEMHAGVLFDFFAFNQYGCNSENTFFKHVLDMRGGHYMVVPLAGHAAWKPTPVRWWDIDLRKKVVGWTDEGYASRYYELFEDAVRLRLRSDVPVGSCLSGGLDSSGIVCVVDKLHREAGVSGLQKTFTATSDHERFDERTYAQSVIDATRVDPHFVLPTAERLLSDLDRLVWHQDEPFLSTSIFAGWCVFHLAKSQGVTVTLDGQGPDEMLGGYVPFTYQTVLIDALSRCNIMGLAREIEGVRKNFGISRMRSVGALLHEVLRGRVPSMFMPSIRRARGTLTKDFFEMGMTNSLFLQELSALSEWNAKVGGSRFDRLMYRLTKNDSLPGILRQVDRNAMAFSIEARLPFLDYRLVEYVFSLPTRQKYSDGIAKRVYRNALRGVLPDRIRERKTKLGFVTAEPEWMKGALRSVFMERLRESGTHGPFRLDVLREEFEETLNGKRPFTTTPWKVFCTSVWMEQISQPKKPEYAAAGTNV